MSVLNLGVLSNNTGDNSGDNRNNSSQVFVQENHGGRELKHRGHHHGHKKSSRKRHCG